MHSITKQLVTVNGNPVQRLVDGLESCRGLAVDLDDSQGIWYVAVGIGWYVAEVAVEIDPTGKVAPAGDEWDNLFDWDTADMLRAMKWSEAQEAAGIMTRHAIAAAREDYDSTVSEAI